MTCPAGATMQLSSVAGVPNAAHTDRLHAEAQTAARLHHDVIGRDGATVDGTQVSCWSPGSRYSSSRHLWCVYSSAVPGIGTGWGKGADSPARIREEVLRGKVACVLEGVLRRWLQQDRDRRSEHDLHRHR